MKLMCQRPHDRRHMARLFSLLALLLTAACGAAVSTPRPAPVSEHAPPPAAQAAPVPAPEATAAALCRPVSFEAVDYTVCEVDLRRYRLGLFWQGGDGRAYGSLYAFKRAMAAAGDPPLVAMNAGMYHEDLSPVGLFVSGGRELHPANEADGDGNFFMKPSDVALHPLFSDDGPSRKTRNGIGIRDDHTVVFAISRDGVSFGSFARLFRDALGCRNALYLDGSVSALSAPDGLSVGWGIRVGPILAVFDRSAPMS